MPFLKPNTMPQEEYVRISLERFKEIENFRHDLIDRGIHKTIYACPSIGPKHVFTITFLNEQVWQEFENRMETFLYYKAKEIREKEEGGFFIDYKIFNELTDQKKKLHKIPLWIRKIFNAV